MPLDPEDIYGRGQPRDRRIGPERDIGFGELVYELAEGIAEGQLKLDFNTAETLTALAETRVDVVPEVTRRTDADGRVQYEAADPIPRSLLELGFAPERYQFSEASVEVDFDLKFSTDEDDQTSLAAGTYEAHHQRKHHGEVDMSGHLSATLVPVPLPPSVIPSEVVGTDPAGQENDERDDGTAEDATEGES